MHWGNTLNFVSQQVPAVDLTNCDREAIHIPGAILPHGAMLVLDEDSLEVLQVAGDTVGLIGHEQSALLGKRLTDLIAGEQVDRFRAILGGSDLVKARHLLDPFMRMRPDRPVDLSVHRSARALVLEFEDADLTDPHVIDPLATVQGMLDGLDRSENLHALCQMAAENVRRVAGYDRVMVYRFQHDDSGWVFAEAKIDQLEPFLDLHYPASDIPGQARAMYLQSWIRLITGVDYEPARLVPQLHPRTGEPLDMSHATLRDVSPIHLEYLRNMGVGASMSISIIVEGKLWGLIACHHSSPRRLPRHLRAICELFGAMFSLQLEARERAAQLEARLASRRTLHDIITTLSEWHDYGAGLFHQAGTLLDYIDANGLALRVSGQGGVAIKVNNGVNRTGNTPSDEQIADLTDWLAARIDGCGGVFVTDRLSELWAPGEAFADIGSGLLALSISVEPRDFILWFRPEAIETVRWAGDPAKPVEPSEYGERLTPRKSFDAWAQEVRHRSAPWSTSDGDAAADLRVSLLDIVLRRIDAAARERERVLDHERLLMNELDHRVKNTLANIQALVAQTSRSATSLADFTLGLERRIRAMSKAHGLLTEGRWTGASVVDIVSQELAQHEGMQAISINGPAVMLTAKASLALSLALHELATNAAKYGALSVAEGAIEVSWERGASGDLEFEWIERGGPRVELPTRRGFGSTLIERALAFETGGEARLNFRPSGLECRIAMPVSTIVETVGKKIRQPVQPFAPEEPSPANQDAAAKRILLVEDSAMVIFTLEAMIGQMGWKLIGPATRLDQALALAKSAPVDAALLDINLDGQMSWPVATVLRERGIPFVFTTGYDGSTVMPEEFSGSPVLGKPFSGEEAAACLHRLLDSDQNVEA